MQQEGRSRYTARNMCDLSDILWDTMGILQDVEVWI